MSLGITGHHLSHLLHHHSRDPLNTVTVLRCKDQFSPESKKGVGSASIMILSHHVDSPTLRGLGADFTVSINASLQVSRNCCLKCSSARTTRCMDSHQTLFLFRLRGVAFETRLNLFEYYFNIPYIRNTRFL